MRPWISWCAIAITLTIAALLGSTADAGPRQDAAKKPDAQGDSPKKADAPSPAPEKLGILLNESRACPGYNLINPSGKKTYLFDNDGRVVHTWTSELPGGAAAYLLENGHLFRPAEAVNRKPGFQGPAAGGRIQEFDWDGNLVWDFEYHSEKRLPHHDAIKLPNGNALLICWEKIDENEAVAQGRRPETVKNSHLQPDCLVEIKPTGPKSGEIVWEWRSWDHLIQDRDKTKPNYGSVAKHPELFDVNYVHGEENQVSKLMATRDGREKLRTLGYVGNAPAAPDDAKKDDGKKDAEKVDAEAAPRNPDAAKGQPKDAQKKNENPGPKKEPDWMHVNAVAYNTDLDQIALSSPHFCEIWIIDHSTTTEEAKGHTGGRWGKGGDILYRWGNPRAARNGTEVDQRLHYQHNIQWIPKGFSGAGHLLVFNNGQGRKPEQYSSVDEFVPPTDKDGNYIRGKFGVFGPDKPLWSYTAPTKKDFYSWFISGAQRLPNGNTLINAGALGVVFEVTPEGETVWKFANPFKNVPPGPPPGTGPARLFQALSRSIRDALVMKEDQRKQLDAIDDELIPALKKTLTAEQIKVLAEPLDPAVASKVPAGEYLSAFKSDKLKLTETQAQALQALQQEFDPKIAKIFTDDQKRSVTDFKKRFATAAAGGRPKPGNTLFRATRYAVDHPAFAGRKLEPGKTLVELQQELDEPAPANEASAAKVKTADGTR
jgi:hypothetical protein